MTEADYKNATRYFQNKYFAIPGDMNHAQSFWGGPIKNGNGNGKIEPEEEPQVCLQLKYAIDHCSKIAGHTCTLKADGTSY